MRDVRYDATRDLFSIQTSGFMVVFAQSGSTVIFLG